MSEQYVLLADIGGTNARFALADTQQPSPLIDDSVRKFQVADFPSLADAARHYLDSVPELATDVRKGVFAVAGRVDGDVARITNHPWIISRSGTQAAIGLDSLRLINDFAAQAMAIELLTEKDLVVIGGMPWESSTAANRTYAVLGPGTGLGVSALIVRDGKRIALETEGGHVCFAAGNPEEAAILDRLSRHHGRVSDERMVSGGGLTNIYRALCEIAGESARPLRPQDVTAEAKLGDKRCQRTLQIFCSVFGAVAGDLALTLGAWDGVFLTGGVVPRLLSELQNSGFRTRFEAKGRFAAAMARVPTVAVVHPHAGLLGAAAFALEDFPAAQPADMLV
jgi:glucokinase